VRFTWPDPVIERGVNATAEGLWISHGTPRESVFLAVEDLGSFVRALLPVRLTGGYTVTFGVWVGLAPADMQSAYERWFAPDYSQLVLEGRLANGVAPWGLLGAPVRLEVRNPDETPYCSASSDATLADVLTNTWPHEKVLAVLPQ
jgi:hypothetical protein